MTPYAVEARFPSVAKEVTEQQYAEAVQIAEAVLHWEAGMVEGEGSDAGPLEG